MYSTLAEYYDLIYHWKPYAQEAGRIRDLLRTGGVPDGAELADIACGTGSHLAHLRTWYSVRGQDASPAMLEIARRKLGDVPLTVGDMAESVVTPPVSAMICMFSAIGYLESEARLSAALACFARGVEPGGVLLIEPWIDETAFVAGTPTMHTYDSPDLKVCRTVVSQKRPGHADLRFHWLIVKRGAPDVEHFTEEHRLWFCPPSRLLELLARAGFEARALHEGLTKDRPLLLGHRRE